MSSDSVLNEDTRSTSPPADVTDDSCIFQYIEIVPRNTDTDDQVTQQNPPAVKKETDDVC